MHIPGGQLSAPASLKNWGAWPACWRSSPVVKPSPGPCAPFPAVVPPPCLCADHTPLHGVAHELVESERMALHAVPREVIEKAKNMSQEEYFNNWQEFTGRLR